jgi:hypothetical protein
MTTGIRAALRRFAVAALIVMAAACGAPQSPSNADVAPSAAAGGATLTLNEAWIAETPVKAKVAAGYVTLSNVGAGADVLLSANSPRSGRVEIHDMRAEGGKMTMRTLETLAIGAGESVTLSPSGMHLMFLDLNAPMLNGETVPVTLVFEKAGAIEATFTVKPLAAAHAHDHAH